MNKQTIILSYFDKSKELIIDNPLYRKQVETLCDFFLATDVIHHDISTELLRACLKTVIPSAVEESITTDSGEKDPSTRLVRLGRDDNGDVFKQALRKNVRNTKAKASIVAKQDGIVAGIEESVYILSKESSIKIQKRVRDGNFVKKGGTLLKLTGDFRQLLTLERTVLNILQRMSGIATETRNLIKNNGLQDSGQARLAKALAKRARMTRKSYIAATRKTLWGWLDKKAVAVGGGLTHRLSLKDGILIKDNHLDLISNNKLIAIEKIIEYIKEKKVKTICEIEVNSFQHAIFTKKWWVEVMGQAPHIMMLDNFSVKEARKTIKAVKSDNSIIELSGGINESNIKEYGTIGADVVSLGSLTHSSKSLDMSLQINL